tara:strand:+ start:133 stop:624 length:492 start_codon:yes stop_codon:yes gene_type:complete
MVMSTPLAGAATPAVAREFRMFSTEVAVREEQLSHAPLKHSAETLAGDQLSNRLAGKVAREVQPSHASLKVVAELNPVARKDVMEEQYRHVWLKLVPAVRASAGMVVRAVQLLQANVKSVPESKPVARKEDMEVHPSHVLGNWVPAVRAIAGKVTREVQPFHA